MEDKVNSKKKQILVDISGLLKYDANTGISRVVKSQINELVKILPKEHVLKTIYLKKVSNKFVHCCCKNIFFKSLQDKPIDLNKNDIIYNPDLSYEDVKNACKSNLYKQYKCLGVKIIFLVHDILPIQYPQFFVEGTKEKHEAYIKDISQVADLILTTTNVGKKDLLNYCKDTIDLGKIETLPLGSNLPIQTLSNTNQVQTPNTQATFLMVGTIEPRKAHKQVIEAFNMIWNESLHNKTSNRELPVLIIVGKQGWLVEKTIKMIKEHTLFNKNLFYTEKADDKELLQYYTQADAIIVASYAEGFGLPLVEAMCYKKHIIARDIPVFNEIAGDYPIYFKNTTDANDIVKVIKSFIQMYYLKPNTKLKKLKLHFNWEEHTIVLLDKLKKPFK